MLPGDEHLPDLHFLEEVRAEVELDRIAELRQVPAVDHEVGCRDMAWTSLNARVVFSTNRVLTSFG